MRFRRSAIGGNDGVDVWRARPQAARDLIWLPAGSPSSMPAGGRGQLIGARLGGFVERADPATRWPAPTCWPLVTAGYPSMLQ